MHIFLTAMKNPWVIGIFSFIASGIFLSWSFEEIYGPITCNDGWSSSSIGTQGACSHHGGVNRSRNGVIFLLTLIIAILTPQLLTGKIKPLQWLKQRKERKKVKHDNRPISPYGTKAQHRELLISSGAHTEDVDNLLKQFADD